MNKTKVERVKKLREKRLKTYPIDLLLNQFNPGNNVADNLILYEITGRKKIGDSCDFSSSTDHDDEICEYETDWNNDGSRKPVKIQRTMTSVTEDDIRASKVSETSGVTYNKTYIRQMKDKSVIIPEIQVKLLL